MIDFSSYNALINGYFQTKDLQKAFLVWKLLKMRMSTKCSNRDADNRPNNRIAANQLPDLKTQAILLKFYQRCEGSNTFKADIEEVRLLEDLGAIVEDAGKLCYPSFSEIEAKAKRSNPVNSVTVDNNWKEDYLHLKHNLFKAAIYQKEWLSALLIFKTHWKSNESDQPLPVDKFVSETFRSVLKLNSKNSQTEFHLIGLQILIRNRLSEPPDSQ